MERDTDAVHRGFVIDGEMGGVAGAVVLMGAILAVTCREKEDAEQEATGCVADLARS